MNIPARNIGNRTLCTQCTTVHREVYDPLSPLHNKYIFIEDRKHRASLL